MKIILIVFAVVVTSSAQSLYPEQILADYVVENTAVKRNLNQLYTIEKTVYDQVNLHFVNVHNTLSEYRFRYGPITAWFFQEKYGSKMAALKKVSNESDCTRQAANLLSLSSFKQRLLLMAIEHAVNSWKNEFDNLDQFVVHTHSNLTLLEHSSHNCSRFQDDLSDMLECAKAAAEQASKIGVDAHNALGDRATAFYTSANVVSDTFLASFQKSNIQSFYDDETSKDQWFINNCSVPMNVDLQE